MKNTRFGILLMLSAVFVFAVQDGISRLLADRYNVYMIVMIRYWFFAAFVMAMAARSSGGLKAATRTKKPFLQILRGALLASQILVMILSFVILGLIPAHSLFAAYPLMVTALSGPVLGEKVGPRRWAAVGIGFIGMMIILQPGFTVFVPEALIAVVAALMFSGYTLLTRYVSRTDSAVTSFFWTGTAGAVVATLAGVWHWEPMAGPDWGWMALLCVTGSLGHFLLIKAYEQAEIAAIQPFAYFQLVFVSIIAVTIFNESIELHIAIGAAIVIGAGLFTAWRENQIARQSNGS